MTGQGTIGGMSTARERMAATEVMMEMKDGVDAEIGRLKAAAPYVNKASNAAWLQGAIFGAAIALLIEMFARH